MSSTSIVGKDGCVNSMAAVPLWYNRLNYKDIVVHLLFCLGNGTVTSYEIPVTPFGRSDNYCGTAYSSCAQSSGRSSVFTIAATDFLNPDLFRVVWARAELFLLGGTQVDRNH
jgi:hypothetical protein